ncbi:hypothetical protein BT93_L3813 [Corymbia citriodora subsp. variegata]|uniref:Uncharacterized protein n=1 Tax=Corymbia citriodora subsp. variegata TaxID=360336 RepID=A0A8T0CGX8_CORYI|nr:hypothetical protein BT93_L3813 [Corymbia citriodora subsp. variegata]
MRVLHHGNLAKPIQLGIATPRLRVLTVQVIVVI